MNPFEGTTTELPRALHDACQAARNLYTGATQRHDSPGLRALKLYLAERHAEHLRDWREIMHGSGGGESPIARPLGAAAPGWGNEILHDLNSSNRMLVLRACLQVEKHLALAYEQVQHDSTLTDAASRALVSRHAAALESSQTFVRDIEAEGNRTSSLAARSVVAT